MSCSTFLKSLLIAVAFFIGVSPAFAAHWVQTRDPWLWIDTDSFVVKDGATYYAGMHGDAEGAAPTAETPTGLDWAVKCASGEVFMRRTMNDDDSGAPPHYQWEQVDFGGSKEYVAAVVHIVCDKR